MTPQGPLPTTLLIRGGRVIDPAGSVDAVQDVLVDNGKIARVGGKFAAPHGATVIDAAGKWVCPGFIDMHVHLREPGHEYKETIASGTRAAAAGGFTAVCCMANTQPVNDNRAVTDYIRAKAESEGVVRVYPIGAVTRGLEGKELAELAELTGAHVHIAHLSTAGGVRLVRDAKARGVRVTAEVTPHHLLLTEDAVRSWDANTKMAPPLRSRRDAEALLEALVDGTIDCVATDHAPHALSEKEGEFDHAANGVVGLETAVTVLVDRLVKPGLLSVATLVSRLSRDPARLLRLPGGSLGAGAPADLTLIDPDGVVTIDPARLLSKSRNTPFAGWTATGRPWKTIVAGKVVWECPPR